VTADSSRFRWLVLAAFVLSSTINFLDRQSLATLQVLVRAEFHLSNQQYGWILTAFSLAYAASAPAAGWWIDRIGLVIAIAIAVAVWSAAGIATGLTSGLAGLVACRAILGMAEAAGIPAAGKAIYQYLRPPERALGNALNQAGVSLGMLLAPPLATWIAFRYGWRQAFVATGTLGLLWIPLWCWIGLRGTGLRPAASAFEPASPRRAQLSRSAGDLVAGVFAGLWGRLSNLRTGCQPVQPGKARPRATTLTPARDSDAPSSPAPALTRDRRLYAIAVANALSMIGYSLWVNWTTLYLVDARHLSLKQAAWYAWIPPLFFALGGAAGGWGSLALIQRGSTAVAARFRVCLAAAALSLVTAAIPAAPSLAWSMAGISLSVFAVAAISVNVYTLPLDFFGGRRAAFAISVLVSSYGISQAVISPWFGRIVDHHGYGPVTAIAAVAPLAACAVLRLAGASR
jgi:ACS family hexuronate transporter-like MFS transporter